jgi:amidase
MRPTLGLLSRTGLVPLSLSLDTVGPMARNVSDIAVVLGVMAGIDPADSATRQSAGRFETDYTKFLKVGSLKGARIGIGRDFFGKDPETIRIMDEAIATLRKLGAVIVDPVRFPEYVHILKEPIFPLIRNAEFKAQIADYFKTLRPGYPKNLEEFTARANEPNSCYMSTSPEKAFSFKYSLTHALDLKDPVYLGALDQARNTIKAGAQAVFTNHRLDAVIYPTVAQQAGRSEPGDVAAGRAALPAGEKALQAALATGSAQTQPGRGGGGSGNESALLIPSYAGFPELVVPAGMTKDGLPITLSFMGQAFTEGKLLGYAYDFEQATRAHVVPKHTPPLTGESIVRENIIR